MKCEVCEEEFVHSDKQEDLCPDCEDAFYEDTTPLLLLQDEVALVFRCDGTTEFFMPEGDPDRDCSPQELLAAAIVIRMHKDKGFIEDCLEYYEKALP